MRECWRLSVSARLRYWIGQPELGWELIPTVGLGLKQFAEVIPEAGADLNAGPFTAQTLTTPGISVGLETRKQLGDRWGLVLSARCFLPLLLDGAPDGSAITSGTSYENFDLGAQAVLRIGRRWAVAAGARYETGSLSFKNGLPPEVIGLSGISGVAGLLLRLGDPVGKL